MGPLPVGPATERGGTAVSQFFENQVSTAAGLPTRRLPEPTVAPVRVLGYLDARIYLARLGQMNGERVERRLAAILAADVAGYSRLMGTDEEGTHGRFKAHLAELVEPKISEHRGRTVKSTGDGFLAEFPSVVDAVRCAAEVQRGMAEREPEIPDDRRIWFRIGINVGDVIAEEHDIFGDGVNIAARLEALAEPGGICVSGIVHDQVRDKLDLAFEDIGNQQVKNIARPVHAWRLRLGEQLAASPTTTPPLPDKPSIAVLPFANMSGDPEQDYFVDGMVEEIMTALSRIRWLFVIARNSSFTYKGQSVDVKRVGRELGVRYVLEGSVRKAGNRVRITAQLIDAQNGAHLWADRFDGSLEDVFELQDKVALSVAGVIEPTLQAAEIRRSVARPTHDLTAYDLYLRALADYSSLEKDLALRALGLLAQAIERDPHYGPALALAALCRQMLASNDWVDDLEANRGEAIGLARRALSVARDDPEILAFAGYALGYFGEDINAGIGMIDRALTFNPSFALGWYCSGVLRIFAGQPDVAIEHFKTSLRLNPRSRQASYGIVQGVAHFLCGRFEEAAALLSASLEQLPSSLLTHRYLASCYAHMGRLDEAREIVKRLRRISRLVIPSIVTLRNPEHRELFLSGLRLAMGEKT
jgi:adenylate cyclase